MNNGIKIGRIFGINISLDYSWFLIFAIITFGLAFALFPQMAPGLNMNTYIIMGVVTSLLFFASVLFHELMHSLVALRNGMAIEGIRLMIFGGVSQLSEEPHSPGVEFRMAIAGPLSSLAIGGIFIAAFFAFRQLNAEPFFIVPAFWLGYINILLGVFNLLPGFPLDGGRVLRSAVWYFTGNLRRATGVAAGLGKGLAYVMILVGIVGPFLNDVSLIWFILLGWYLLRAADYGYQQALFQEAAEGIKVNQAMTRNPETVEPDIKIEEAVRDHFMKHSWVAYPVVENGDVQGMITLDSLENVPQRSWKRKSVRDVMNPISVDMVVSPDSEVNDVLPKLYSRGRMLVMKGGRLLGILTIVDIIRTVNRHIRHTEEEEKSERPAA